MILLIIFLFGLIIGSFLNVCICRMPKEESVVVPGSHCPECNTPIKWYDNIPVLSYILLKGKCRSCKKSISPRYMLVELLTALMLVLTYFKFQQTPEFFIFSYVFCALIVSTFIDFKYQIIPDEINYSGIVLGLLISTIYPKLHSQAQWYMGLLESVKGLLAGGGAIYLTGLIGKLIFRKDAMGGGDVKLMAMLGAFLGFKNILIVFFLAPFLGAPVGVFMKIKFKSEIIPYGPYLALATVISVFWADNIIKVLLRL